MKYFGLLCCAAVLALTVSAKPAGAHHSFAAEYDRAKPITFTGKVTKIEWTNPHAFFYVDVQDKETGKVTNWASELNSPNSLMRLGWTRDSMKVDDVVTVTGSRAKDGTNLMNVQTVVLEKTKQRLFGGSSDGSGPTGPPTGPPR